MDHKQRGEYLEPVARTLPLRLEEAPARVDLGG